jgi:glutamate--cysteine ligase
MPTENAGEAVRFEEAFARAGERAFGGAGGARLGGIGLEPEFFPIYLDEQGCPAGRMRLEGPEGVLSVLDEMAQSGAPFGARRGPEHGPWEYVLSNGGRLTFEPGAQIEHSTTVHPTASAAIEDVQELIDLVQAALLDRGVVLASIGLDHWHSIEQVPQQLRASRYLAQAEYYEHRGPWGRTMMRQSASTQINLDLGPDGVWQERWLLANLVSPLITASFACSPAEGLVSARARAWQRLDPTRSGFPKQLLDGSSDDPRAQWATAAMAADVMMIRCADGRVRSGYPGLSFEEWLREGHEECGWPTRDDLDYHLTTLFFEVRPRGFLELRAGEALPDSWRPAPVVLLASLLYDDEARRRALTELSPVRPELADLWVRAAETGVRDAQLGRLANVVWDIAMAGAERLPVGYVRPEHLAGARAFLERYTSQQRMPADDLAELEAVDAALALAWASGCPASTAAANNCVG